MSKSDGINDEIRKREEEYFRQKDRELIERMRQTEAAARLRKALEQQSGIHDDASLRELEELGFTPETCALLPLVPVVKVAWAEGGVSNAERAAIVSLARARGISEGSACDQLLASWLELRPSDETFRKALRLIAAMIGQPGTAAADITADELLKYADDIAHASGGLFGIGSVSAEERTAIEQIAAQLKSR